MIRIQALRRAVEHMMIVFRLQWERAALVQLLR